MSSSSSPVIGLVDLVASQRSIADRSYECPSAAITGSLMSSVVIGQMKSAGGSSLGAGAPAPEDGPCASAARLQPRALLERRRKLCLLRRRPRLLRRLLRRRLGLLRRPSASPPPVFFFLPFFLAFFSSGSVSENV